LPGENWEFPALSHFVQTDSERERERERERDRKRERLGCQMRESKQWGRFNFIAEHVLSSGSKSWLKHIKRD
jgi:hypothetical protein